MTKMSKELDKFIEQWRKENNTEYAVYSSYHYDAMEAYANEQVIKELSDWVQFTKSIKPSVLSMMKDRIKELKQK